MTVSPEALLFCPFCGGEPYAHICEEESLWSHNIVDWLTIGCSECDYSMSSEVQDELRAKWNSRALSSVPGIFERTWRFLFGGRGM